MTASQEKLDLAELADRSGVSVRTIRYYIQQELLDAPAARGPGAHYSLHHLERLVRIKGFQREHLPLAEIRKRLDANAPAAATPAPLVEQSLKTADLKQSQWERIDLSADVELHVRRPLTRAMTRRVEQLVRLAREALADEA